MATYWPEIHWRINEDKLLNGFARPVWLKQPKSISMSSSRVGMGAGIGGEEREVGAICVLYNFLSRKLCAVSNERNLSTVSSPSSASEWLRRRGKQGNRVGQEARKGGRRQNFAPLVSWPKIAFLCKCQASRKQSMTLSRLYK